MATKLLLLEDVETLGRSGELVNVKPGYARNYLIPQGFAVTANKQTLRQQERLKDERQKKAAVDKSDSEKTASGLSDVTVNAIVKVDHEGHMYGSVSSHEIVELLQQQQNIELDKRSIQLKAAIKTVGTHTITVKLKEGVTASFNLQVMSEEEYKKSQQEEKSAK